MIWIDSTDARYRAATRHDRSTRRIGIVSSAKGSSLPRCHCTFARKRATQKRRYRRYELALTALEIMVGTGDRDLLRACILR
jgi:hypothetical protein